MARIRHLLSSHVIDPRTEILIVGTFNPRTPENEADFFYGRRRNYLWRLLPASFGEASLKGSGREEKTRFMKRRRIDFTDLIREVEVENPADYNDGYIDGRVTAWNNVIAEIEKLKYIRKVCLTRKTFSGIPNIKEKAGEIREYCAKRGIAFRPLVTPSRCYGRDKEEEWSAFLSGGEQD